MSRVTTVCFLIAALLLASAPVSADPPVFNGIAISPSFTIPSTATIVGFGDSITYGQYATSCSTGTTAHTPTGTCYLDKVGEYYSAQVANLGIEGSCLESTTYAGSICDNSNAGYARYTSSLIPFAGKNTWVIIVYGTDDVTAVPNDNQVTVSHYKTQYAKIVSDLINAGEPPQQIILGEIPYSNAADLTSEQPDLYAFNEAAAQIAIQYGTRLATTYESMAACAPGCMSNDLHPNDTGYANMATAVEAANYSNALSAQSAFALMNGRTYYTAPATNIAATGTVTIGKSGVAQDPAIKIGSAMSGNYTALGASGNNAVAGVTPSALYVQNYNNSNLVAVDPSGDMGLAAVLTAIGGVRPNGSAGGYAPTVFPLGATSAHPIFVSGNCAVTAPSTACTFLNSGSFADTTYQCVFSIEGATPQNAPAYDTKTTTGFTVHITTSATVDYICLR